MELIKRNIKIIKKISVIGYLISVFAVCSLIFLGATYDEIVSDKNRQIERVQNEIEANRQKTAGSSDRLAELNRSIDSIKTALISEFTVVWS